MSAPTRSMTTTMCGTRPGSCVSSGSRAGCGDHSAISSRGLPTSGWSSTTVPSAATTTARPPQVPASPPSLPCSSRPRTASTTASGAPCPVSFSATARTRRSSSVSAFSVVCETSAQTVAKGPGVLTTGSRKETSMVAAYPPTGPSHPVWGAGGAGRRSPMTEHDQLPLPDYDHLPIGGLASRIRTLDAAGVQTLLDYEKAHGNRLQVVQIMRNRLTSLQSGAQPSGGAPAADFTPEAGVPAAGGSKVSEATTGPAMNPPSQGDPTNPAQPRSTG